MGILKRVEERQMEAYMRQGASEFEKERVRKAQVLQLAAIIEDALKKFADTLEEDFAVVKPGVFFRIGGIILLVELFQRGQLPDSSCPLVTMEYATSLIGIDIRSERPDKVRVGTLSFLSFDTLYAVITKASHMDFDADRVLEQQIVMDELFG